jgi:hypothetical protein
MAAYLSQIAKRGSPRRLFGVRNENAAAWRERGETIRIYGALVILLSVTMTSGLTMLDGSITAWISGGPLGRICQSR